MSGELDRRSFLEAGVGVGLQAALGSSERESNRERSSPESLVLNDDGHVFLLLSDGLGMEDLRNYLRSYCAPGVGAVAFCVGDMSWPTIYPTRVGMHRGGLRGGHDLRRSRMYKNLERFASEPGGYLGASFRLIREFGKKVHASFRMNDAHVASASNPYVSEFWTKHAKQTLGSAYGYYGGCLNYASEAVRKHFLERVVEFVELYPDVDGVELDAMRSPYFFPPDKGKEQAPLFTGLVREIKSALAERAERLKRPPYRLSINVPLTPEVALESGLDVAAWDAERLFHRVSVGPYQAYMDHPIRAWKKLLRNGTPVYSYINCSPQSGQYLGLEEYRAAAANAHGGGADGVYLFNYPCLFELAAQRPAPVDRVPASLIDLRAFGHPDFGKVAKALDEIGAPESLRYKNKRYLFHYNYNNDAGYRHHAPTLTGLDRRAGGSLKARFQCYEEDDVDRVVKLRFKLENTARTERFNVVVNGRRIEPERLSVSHAANGRDTRIHTVGLGPYLEYEMVLPASHMVKGENLLEVAPAKLEADLSETVHLREIELLVKYD